MPYAIPANAICEVRLRSTFFGQVVINTFHYRNGESTDDGDNLLSLIYDDFNAVVWSAIAPGIAASVTAVKIDAQWVFPTRFRVKTRDADPAQGQSVATTAQTGTSAVIKRWGEAANKHNQGRIYVYGVGTAFQSAGQWTDVFLLGPGADMVDAVKANLNPTLTNVCIPVIWSAPVGGIGVPIIDGAVNPVIRYQRRREIGVGQ